MVEVKKAVSKTPKKKGKYDTQNRKIWTINFSAATYVARAKTVVDDLMKRCSMASKGLTVMLAVEYCLQERISKDFILYVKARKGKLYKGR